MPGARNVAEGEREERAARLAGETPFFIVGNDRSGTTMLRLIVDRGPDAAVPPESMFLTDFKAAFDAGGPRDEEAAARLMSAVWEHPKIRLWELAGQPPTVPQGLSGQDAYRFIAAAPFEAYAARHGKRRWGDKTPHYVHHIEHLLRLWPRARFIVLVRDGRDVALSLRRMPFGPNNAWAAAQWWARGIRAGARAQGEHPDAVLTIRYEDLAERPHDEVRRLCSFVGLSYADDMLALEHVDPARIVPDQAAWFPTLFNGINTSAVGRWRREMGRRDQRIFAALAGAELEQLGYDVERVSGPALSARQERWFHYHNELMRNVNFLRLRLVQERGRELRFALARRLRDPVKRAG
jgi:Sulfotransferase family